MIRTQYAVISEYQRPGQSNKLDLLGLFDRVFAASVPAQHRNLVFSALLIAETEDDLGKKPMRFSIQTPSGKPLMEQRGELAFKPNAGTWFSSVRLVFDITGLPLPEFGKYLLILEVGNKEVARHPLTVTQGSGPQK